jgi:TolB-like protein
MSFLNELKRRNVFRVGLVYLASAWLVAQVTAILVPAFAWPSWVLRTVIVVLAVGFPIALIAAWLFELTPEGLKRTSDVEAEQSIRPITGRKLDRLLIGVLVAVVIVLLANLFLIERRTPTPTETASTTSVGGVPTLAVLPFADMSPNKDQGYFADGTAEEILNALAQVKGLQVTGRTSPFYFKGKEVQLSTIAKTLGVENILEGSIRKEGDEVRVTAQLINARTGYHIWSQTYDRKLTDIFAIQDDISKSVAQALQVTLGIGVFGQAGMTHNVNAYDEYLQSLAAALGSVDDMHKAIDHAERAIALDPSFSVAEVQLYYNDWHASYNASVTEAEDLRRQADDALARAREATPDVPFVLAAELDESVNRGRWLDADRISKRLLATTVERVVGSGVTLNQASLLLATGRIREAIAFMERQRAIDPLDGIASLNLGIAYTEAGDIKAALAEFERGLAHGGPQSPINAYGHLAAMISGNRTEMEKWSALDQRTSDPATAALGVRLTSLQDDRAAAIAEIRRMTATLTADQNITTPFVLSFYAAYWGDPALALDLLNRIPAAGDSRRQVYLVWNPVMRDVRKLHGFKDFVRTLGLDDYWRQSGHWGDYCRPVGDNDFECS